MNESDVQIESISLNFFGIGTRVNCVEKDISDIQFLCKGFLTPPGEIEVNISLTCLEWKSRGFFTSIFAKDQLRKRVEIETRSAQGIKCDSYEFTDWIDKPSPLPPLRHSSLWKRMATFSGVALRLPDGRLILFLGKNYVGKTYWAIEFCKRGSLLVASPLIVMNTLSGEIQTYESPLGVRGNRLREQVTDLETLDHRLTVSEVSGLVALIPPSELLGVSNAEGGRTSSIYFLDHGPEISIEIVSTPKMNWYTGVEDIDQNSLLPAKSYLIRTTPNTSFEDMQRLIETHQ